MMQHFPEVTYWITINEPAVFTFQTYISGVFPPGIKGEIAAAGIALRNLLIAHCKIYREAKKRSPELHIGLTHQWLKFYPLEGNPLEKMICHLLSEITHFSVYRFFQTGEFSLKIPFKANIQFTIPPEEFQSNRHFLDTLYVQWYGCPWVKAGWNQGKTYPGYAATNYIWGKRWGLTFGSTCPQGRKMMSFGASYHPESLEDSLKEAMAIGRPIAISEVGCDANLQDWGSAQFAIDDEAQHDYFKQILLNIKKSGCELQAFFVWTLIRNHLEWDRGDFPKLGLIKIDKDDRSNILNAQLSPAAKFLQTAYSRRRTRASVDGK